MKKLMTIGAAVVLAAVFTACSGGTSSDDGNPSAGNQPYTFTDTDGELVRADSYFTKTGENTYRFVLSNVKTKYTGSDYIHNYFYTLLAGMDSFDHADENNTDVTFLKERHLHVNFVSGNNPDVTDYAGFIVYNENEEEYKSANLFCLKCDILPTTCEVDRFYGAFTRIIATKTHTENTDFLCVKGIEQYYTEDSYREFYYYGDHLKDNDPKLIIGEPDTVLPYEHMQWGLVVYPAQPNKITPENPYVVEFTIEEVE